MYERNPSLKARTRCLGLLSILIIYNLLHVLPLLSPVLGSLSANIPPVASMPFNQEPSPLPISSPFVESVSAEILPSELSIDLSNWKLTLPTGPEDHPTEIFQPDLENFIADPWFEVMDSGALRFRAPVNGVTTSGSEYPRSELREMEEGGHEKAAWSSTEGVHRMEIDQAITAVPLGKQHVVAGQIHDSEDDVIQVRLEGTKLKIDIFGEDGPVLTENYQLGDRFTVAFEVEAGKTRIYYNGELVLEVDGEYDGAYFKAGVYTQSNCEKEAPKDCNDNNFGEVIIYGLNIAHS